MSTACNLIVVYEIADAVAMVTDRPEIEDLVPWCRWIAVDRKNPRTEDTGETLRVATHVASAQKE